MDLQTAMDLVVADVRANTRSTLDYRDALRETKQELTWHQVQRTVKDRDLRNAYRVVLGTEWAGISARLPENPHAMSPEPGTTTTLYAATGSDQQPQREPEREQRAQTQQRDNEDRVLASARQLDPDDHSGRAEQLREAAGSIAEHREMHARREQWRREDERPGTAAEQYWPAGASHQTADPAEDSVEDSVEQREAGQADPWRPPAAPVAGTDTTPAPRPAVSAETAERTRACVASTDEALRACDAALADLDEVDAAQAERQRATELARRHTAEQAAESDTGLDREV